MKRLMIAVAFVLVLVMPITASALDFEIGPWYEGVDDVTVYTSEVGSDNTTGAATGVCSGVFAKVMNEGKWIADVLSPCAYGGAQFEDEAEGSALAGVQLLNFMGFRTGLAYSVDDQQWTWTFGIKMSSFLDRMTE